MKLVFKRKMYLILSACFVSILTSGYCEDNITTIQLTLKTKNNNTGAICVPQKDEPYHVEEGQKIKINVTSRFDINYAFLGNKELNESSPEDITRFEHNNRFHGNFVVDNIQKNLNGTWTIRFLTPQNKKYQNRSTFNGKEYTLIVCTVTISVKEGPHIDSKLMIIIGLSVGGFLLAIVMICQTIALIYWKNKALARSLEELARTRNEPPSDTDRYSTMPGKKAIMKLGIKERCDSEIYETLETILTDRDRRPEPPSLDTLPRPSRPQRPLPVEKQVLTASVSSLASDTLPRPSVHQLQPQRAPHKKSKNCSARIPSPPCLEEIYEPSPEFPPDTNPSETEKPSFLRWLGKGLKPKLSASKPEVKDKLSDQPTRSSVERIKERGPHPLPVDEDEYIDMSSVAGNTLEIHLRHVTKRNPEPSPIKQRPNTQPRRPKPAQLSLKPQKSLPPAPTPNIGNEIDKILKKRRNDASTPSIKPKPPINEPANRRKLPRPHPRPRPDKAPRPTRRPVEAPSSEATPYSTQQRIPVEPAVNFDDLAQSDGEEWTYEPLPQYNIYSI